MSNGAAENIDKTFKLGLKKVIQENINMSMSSIINKYLLFYRNSKHITTGKTPSEIIFKRQVRTRFDKIKIWIKVRKPLRDR